MTSCRFFLPWNSTAGKENSMDIDLFLKLQNTKFKRKSIFTRKYIRKLKIKEIKQNYSCPCNLLNKMAKFVYIVVFCTAIWAGTLIRAGVKFQIALIPHATIKSATF